MDKTLEEDAQVNAAAREKVVALPNFINLDPLTSSPNSSNHQVAKLILSLPCKAMTDVSKNTSAVTKDADEAASNEHL